MSMIDLVGGKGTGYLARAKDSSKGVLVLQEWWGLVPHIKDVADRCAAAGFHALAPDLWDGQATTRPDDAGRLFMALNIADVEHKLRAAVATLRAQGVTGKIGALGFCMGGQLALYAATRMADEISACVDFYGIHPKVTCDFTALRAPVLGVFGARDKSVDPAAAHALEHAIKAAGGRCEIHIYPADHAFFNDTRPEVYDAVAAADAWTRTTGFLTQHLT